jgi:DNA-binding PadR family transcriptional regulator
MIKYLNIVNFLKEMAIKITNMVKFYTLLLVSSKPMHGYDIIMEISDKLGRKISAGQIYPFLKTLEKNGIVVHSKPGEREKKKYHLTKKGKKFVLDVTTKFGAVLDVLVQNNLKICEHCKAKILGLGHVVQLKGRSLVFCCPYCAASYFEGKKSKNKTMAKQARG